MKRPRIGDIIEIPTAKGLAYAQYTHQHPQFGGLIRVFDTLHEKRPDNFGSLVKGDVRFSTFFPLQAAVKRGIYSVVGHQEVASPNKPFPIFRNGIADPETKKVSAWWFWDGQKEWRVGEITPEQRKFPLLGVWNDTMLVCRIEEGWHPETDYG
jgi:hypothetical protein